MKLPAKWVKPFAASWLLTFSGVFTIVKLGCVAKKQSNTAAGTQISSFVENGKFDFISYSQNPAQVYTDMLIRSRKAEKRSHFLVNEWAPYLTSMRDSLITEITQLKQNKQVIVGRKEIGVDNVNMVVDVMNGMNPDNLPLAQETIKKLNKLIDSSKNSELYYDDFWKVLPFYTESISVLPQNDTASQNSVDDSVKSILEIADENYFTAPFMGKDGLTKEMLTKSRAGGIGALEIPSSAVAIYVDGGFKDSRALVYHDAGHYMLAFYTEASFYKSVDAVFAAGKSEVEIRNGVSELVNKRQKILDELWNFATNFKLASAPGTADFYQDLAFYLTHERVVEIDQSKIIADLKIFNDHLRPENEKAFKWNKDESSIADNFVTYRIRNKVGAAKTADLLNSKNAKEAIEHMATADKNVSKIGSRYFGVIEKQYIGFLEGVVQKFR